ncbi:MAG TPA: hypothetical protein VMH37_09505 [Candidatus Binataceae bacterium]|nr:hypothetical protein [Candidatus Binataceae bacterium]
MLGTAAAITWKLLMVFELMPPCTSLTLTVSSIELPELFRKAGTPTFSEFALVTAAATGKDCPLLSVKTIEGEAFCSKPLPVTVSVEYDCPELPPNEEIDSVGV